MNHEATKASHTKNRLEWTVFSISLLLLLGTIGTLVHQMIHTGDAPPHLLVTLGDPQSLDDQVRVPVKLDNIGDQPAASIHIEVTAIAGGSEKKANLFFDHIAHQSQREGWASFPSETSLASLTARVTGYAIP